MPAVRTPYATQDGLRIYDLDPQASELWAVAGPDGLDPTTIDPDNLPAGCRWLEETEWASALDEVRAKLPRHNQEEDYGGAFDGFTVSSDADPGL